MPWAAGEGLGAPAAGLRDWAASGAGTGEAAAGERAQEGRKEEGATQGLENKHGAG